MQNGFSLLTQAQDLYFHHVAPGDTLSGIIKSYYPNQINRMQDMIKQVLIDNPSIKDPNIIKPGQLVVLRTAPSNMCLAPIYNELSLGLAGGGVGLFTVEKALKTNMSLLKGIPDAYHQYKSGAISKYEFDKIRTSKLNLYTKNIGPVINKGIYGDTKVKNAFKLPPGRSLNATKSMTQHLTKLSRISKTASNGGMLLAGAGLAASCYQMNHGVRSLETKIW